MPKREPRNVVVTSDDWTNNEELRRTRDAIDGALVNGTRYVRLELFKGTYTALRRACKAKAGDRLLYRDTLLTAGRARRPKRQPDVNRALRLWPV